MSWDTIKLGIHNKHIEKEQESLCSECLTKKLSKEELAKYDNCTGSGVLVSKTLSFKNKTYV